MLATYTRSNQHAVASHLGSLRKSLRRQGNHMVQTMFGGSVRRGTDVVGLSDVDVLLTVDESSLRYQSPSDVMEYVREAVRRHLFSHTVRAGILAATVNYPDGTGIQLLPALRTSSGGIRITEPGSSGWTNVVRSEVFARKVRSSARATPSTRTVDRNVFELWLGGL